MAIGKITKRCADSLSAGERDSFLWDTDLRGFGLKLTPAGRKIYVLQYRVGGRSSRLRRYTIGTHGSPWTPDSARRRAQELLLQVGRGIDPLDADSAARRDDHDLAFDRYIDLFIERYAKPNQVRSWKQSDQVLRFYALPRFRSRPLNSISRREIASLIEDVAASRKATGRYLHAVLRKLFRWSVARGDIQHSPMADMPAPAAAPSRDRVLRDDELVAVWHAAAELSFPFGPMFQLLIATGQRREEIAGLAWSELDFKSKLWSIPAARSKNGIAQLVPLNALAIDILSDLREKTGEGLAFSVTGKTAPSGWSKAKARLDALIAKRLTRPLEPWRTHDLRRTLATGMQRLGVRFEVTESILNHLSGSRSGVAGVYQRHNWLIEKRAALVFWSEALQSMFRGEETTLTPAAGDVVPIAAAIR